MINKLKFGRFKLSLLFLIIFSVFNKVYAQANVTEVGDSFYDVLALSFVIMLLVILFGFFMFGTEEKSEEVGAYEKKEKKPLWAKIKYYLNRAEPLEKEDEILLEHDYDGIKELDNRIPPWFQYLFYGTIIFAIYYMFNYEIFKTGESQAEEYMAEVHAAEVQQAQLEKSGALVNAETVTRLTDPADLAEGKDIFKSNCVACHGPEGGGVVGPNLTDDYWIHGGGIKNIYTTISEGVPSKGMVSWKTQLNPKQIQKVASFVMSIHGTNPANPKPPQGTKYEEQGEKEDNK